MLRFALGWLGSDSRAAHTSPRRGARGERLNENERIIREFIRAWSRLDADELATYFTDDGVYHNMPTQPVRGRENVRRLIEGFLSTWTQTDWEIRNLLSVGNVVIAERLDRTQAGAKSVDLPCTGVFELEGGKIKEWRDYFDFATYQRAMG